VLFGVFFMFASALQAAWSVLILIRPSRTLLEVGVFGNAAVVLIFLLSRTYGMPFGPEPFRREALTGLGIVATVCEVAVETGALWLLYAGWRHPSGRYAFITGAERANGVVA
jgi:hypothetical protein